MISDNEERFVSLLDTAYLPRSFIIVLNINNHAKKKKKKYTIGTKQNSYVMAFPKLI